MAELAIFSLGFAVIFSKPGCGTKELREKMCGLRHFLKGIPLRREIAIVRQMF
jgi:hypothetical protein